MPSRTLPPQTDRQWLCIGSANTLQDRGEARVFDLNPSEALRGFAIRYHTQIRCYVNRCPHRGSELDWQRGVFFNTTKQYLTCATHGAHFEPLSGRGVTAPCKYTRLTPLPCQVKDGQIWVRVG